MEWCPVRSNLSPLSSTIAPSYPTQVEEAQLPSKIYIVTTLKITLINQSFTISHLAACFECVGVEKEKKKKNPIWKESITPHRDQGVRSWTCSSPPELKWTSPKGLLCETFKTTPLQNMYIRLNLLSVSLTKVLAEIWRLSQSTVKKK